MEGAESKEAVFASAAKRVALYTTSRRGHAELAWCAISRDGDLDPEMQARCALAPCLPTSRPVCRHDTSRPPLAHLSPCLQVSLQRELIRALESTSAGQRAVEHGAGRHPSLCY